jgi:hypothetical protein
MTRWVRNYKSKACKLIFGAAYFAVLCSPSFKSQDAIGHGSKAGLDIRNRVLCTPGFSWSKNAALYILVLNEAVPAERIPRKPLIYIFHGIVFGTCWALLKAVGDAEVQPACTRSIFLHEEPRETLVQMLGGQDGCTCPCKSAGRYADLDIMKIPYDINFESHNSRRLVEEAGVKLGPHSWRSSAEQLLSTQL